MQRPTGKLVAAHLGFAHGVEEELEIPGGAGQGAEQIIRQHGCLFCRVSCYWRQILHHDGHLFGNLPAGGVECCFDDRLVFNPGINFPHTRREILVPGFIADVEHEAPYRIRSETADQHDHQHRQTLPQHWRSMSQSKRFDGVSCSEAVSKAGAHHAGQGGDRHAFFKIKFLDHSFLLFG